jgi:hypothetical protein
MKDLVNKLGTAAIVSMALASGSAKSVDARDIVCNREVEVCVPCVSTVQQVRKVTQEVPVVCYRTEKRLVNRTFVEPTCDPCNPFAERTCQQEIDVQVPYVSKQLIERQIVENFPVVSYHRERRIVSTVVHVDDCAEPACAPACVPRGNNWYPGKYLGEFLDGVHRNVLDWRIENKERQLNRLYDRRDNLRPTCTLGRTAPIAYPQACSPAAPDYQQQAPMYQQQPGYQQQPRYQQSQQPEMVPVPNSELQVPPAPIPANPDLRPQSQSGMSAERVAMDDGWRPARN